jgi:hypothetical protein
MKLKITNMIFHIYHAVVSFVVNFCHFKKNIKKNLLQIPLIWEKKNPKKNLKK